MARQFEEVQAYHFDCFPRVLFQILFSFLTQVFRAEKQHLEFIKYNTSIPTCGFTLELGMESSSSSYFSKIISLTRV